MAPLTTHLLGGFMPRGSSFEPSEASEQLKAQWILPGDVFSILLILGGDVVLRALAQLAGGRLTPVSFSFGWVAYAVSALVSTFGENKLMPQSPDCHCKVINSKTGHTRDNTSWILGRVVRDFDRWQDDATKRKLNELLDLKWEQLKTEDPDAVRPTRAGLVVTVYRPSTTQQAAVPRQDLVYWSGIVTLVAQLGIAVVPCVLWGDWAILMITAGGTALAMATGSLPQWAREKWACRRGAKHSYILTRGNGAQHAVVLLGNQHGLNLEDLAAGQDNIEVAASRSTGLALFGLAVLWIALLISASGLQDNTWFLLAVGTVGMVQNVFAAGWSRRPENFGIPLEFVQVVGHIKVMNTLVEVEQRCPGLGRSMLDEFFPGGTLSREETDMWEQLKSDAQQVTGHRMDWKR